jgi:hypothetical protein
MPEYLFTLCFLITSKQKINLIPVKTFFKHPVLKVKSQRHANILRDDDDDCI